MALTNKLTAIANAIRSKTGKTETMTLDQMPTEIESISSGNGIEPFDLTIITFDREGFAKVVYEKLGQYVNPVVTVTGSTSITSFGYAPIDFAESLPNVTDIVCTNSISMESAFSDTKAKSTSEIPKITAQSYVNSIRYLFNKAKNLETIEPDFFDNVAIHNWHNYNGCSHVFSSCVKLKEVPEKIMKLMYDEATKEYNSFMNTSFTSCNNLRKLNKIQVPSITNTSNVCPYYEFANCKSITFDIDDGIKTWNASSQTINFVGVGWRSSASYETDYGIPYVDNDTLYQQYKNEPDWFGSVDYAKYNKTSAIETINSLSDTSAYLASNGGTNTIKFKGAAGALTDGGAINTMTAEEIAVATVKGWTVAFS